MTWFQCHTVPGGLPLLSHCLPTTALSSCPHYADEDAGLRAAACTRGQSHGARQPRAWVCPWQCPAARCLSFSMLPLKEMGCLCHLFLSVGSQLGKAGTQWTHLTSRKKQNLALFLFIVPSVTGLCVPLSSGHVCSGDEFRIIPSALPMHLLVHKPPHSRVFLRPTSPLFQTLLDDLCQVLQHHP